MGSGGKGGGWSTVAKYELKHESSVLPDSLLLTLRDIETRWLSVVLNLSDKGFQSFRGKRGLHVHHTVVKY